MFNSPLCHLLLVTTLDKVHAGVPPKGPATLVLSPFPGYMIRRDSDHFLLGSTKNAVPPVYDPPPVAVGPSLLVFRGRSGTH